MEFKIRGTTLQVVDVTLEEGESVFCEGGGMAWMSPNIEMRTETKGGILAGLGRKLAGESFFMNVFTCTRGRGLIAFAQEAPGKIVHKKLGEGERIIAQKYAFMFAEEGGGIKMRFRKKIGAGLFGGEGFILQEIIGPGNAFFELFGEIVEYELKEGQLLKIDPGHIGMYEPTISYDITRVKGFKNVLFGGEGIFLATLRGPGKVWLQSMPLSNLRAKLLMPGIK